MTQKKGLGMGLSALIPQNESKSQTGNEITIMKITEIEPNREQPRRIFEEDSLLELAESIKTHGILQPIIVRKNEDFHEIVTGERRWRAARIAGLMEIPAIIRDYDELNTLQVALIENLQRENLNSIEEALTYKRLQTEFNLTQDAIAAQVGKKRSTIANSLRILNLSEQVQGLIAANKITAGHAKALLAVDDHNIQNTIAEKIIESDLNVRQVENLMKKIAADKKEMEPTAAVSDKSIYYKSVEQDLNNLLGTKVKILNGKNKGKIEIEYFSDGDLNRLIELFKKLEANY